MSLRDRPWFPWASALGWGLLVLVLVLVNSGSVLLAVALGVVVTLISRRIDATGRR